MQVSNIKALDSRNEASMILSVVIPCYNEEAVLQETYSVLRDKMHELIESRNIHPKSFLCFVDDGSKDNTWNIIKNLSRHNYVVDTFTPPPPV